jgi:hypothetical protein
MDVYREMWSLATSDSYHGQTTVSYILSIGHRTYNSDI